MDEADILKEQISKFKSDVSDLTENIASLKKDVQDIETRYRKRTIRLCLICGIISLMIGIIIGRYTVTL